MIVVNLYNILSNNQRLGRCVRLDDGCTMPRLVV